MLDFEEDYDSICDMCGNPCMSDETQTPAEGEYASCTVCNDCAALPVFKGIRWTCDD